MRIQHLLLVAVAVIGFAAHSVSGNSLAELSAKAVSSDGPTAAEAIRQLRAGGQSGLDALYARHSAEIESFKRSGVPDDRWKRVSSALDSVAMQKDAYSSRLFWYTDLEEAKKVAAAQQKPILSLRLLGDLNQEFSCANSRLFRSILYANSSISTHLRENYILHWRSVRPAPRITIDFGDGRKIERTITGNSIHYVLGPDGTIIDALPGLYGPNAFLGNIKAAEEAFHTASSMPVKQRLVSLFEYRKRSFDRITNARTKSIKETGIQLKETRTGTSAILAAPLAVAKMVVVDEYSLLRVFDDFAKFEGAITFDDWNKLARIYSDANGVDPQTVAMIRRQNLKTGLTDAQFSSLLARLDSFIALDTTRNDFLFRTKVLEWLNQQRPRSDVEVFNTMVYDRLFQTPNSDEWLGLYSSDVYTALDGNGLIR